MAIDVMSNTLPDGMRNTSVTHRGIQSYYNIQYEHTIDFHRIICKIEQHVRRVSTDVIAYPQSVAIDSSPGVGFVFSDLYDVFFRELIVSIFNRHLFSMLCH